MSKPAADMDLSLPLVRGLLHAQHPDISQLPLAEAASGWDNAIFRLGDELAVRLPRRDRATHLASVWMLFPERRSRQEAIAACQSVTQHTWQRARGWALLVSLAILDAGDPALLALAERTMQCLLDGP